MDDLKNFRSGTEDAQQKRDVAAHVELLILEQGGLAFAVKAEVVDSVVPWQPPAALPKASPRVHGIIQDRGRLITVRRPECDGVQTRRIVLCATSKGIIGLPATSTRSVGTVFIRGPLKMGSPVDTDQGALTILDSEELAREMTEGK